ncbi:hypothetical protein BpHYR1_015176 [Brachionus plicatilis]|uniref:Uncharacterized protein n=1 Tax=Brachionus plicatilis TaxID=10195 RepID=A0A3M7QXC3_BRAPC|nr:hypothetical protein BpHYR1_015176 [Brachionus plicatilis]
MCKISAGNWQIKNKKTTAMSIIVMLLLIVDSFLFFFTLVTLCRGLFKLTLSLYKLAPFDLRGFFKVTVIRELLAWLFAWPEKASSKSSSFSLCFFSLRPSLCCRFFFMAIVAIR